MTTKHIAQSENASEVTESQRPLGHELGCEPGEVNVYYFIKRSSSKQKPGSSNKRQICQMKRLIRECKVRGWGAGAGDHIIEYSGVPACHHHGENFEDKAGLRCFLQQAQQGKLKSHPLLVVDGVDTFSLAEIDTENSLLWALVKTGCAVLFVSSGLILKPGDECDATKRIRLIWELDRAHKESERRAMFALRGHAKVSRRGHG